ncbi:S8 family peptidase [Peribacillus frigoritolerans]|uniref:S8 family peptidase n=1 Tax=Peribacillus frigoritolerans TaxID=450367 RepID=A0AAJ1VDT0_9BACI|nr:S8 family peptidase [Peribacillus frigoritolerans]MDM5283678.1 S8 family peptidase [Peribacillus frigoritolerans]
MIFLTCTTLVILKNYSAENDDKKKEIELVNNSTNYQSDLQLLEKTNEQIVPWGVNSLVIAELLEQKKTNERVKVAILDSGINVNHEDLSGKIVKEFNAINPGQPIIDEFGHGTAVAGIIAANNNKIGIKGMSSNVEIYSVKILDHRGKGNIESLIKGIRWCLEQKVQVINISFGMTSDNPELRKVINKAINSGIIVVAASGNNYGLGSDFPAGYKDVISVTAVNKSYKKASFSAKGKIDFSLPGVDILTTSKDGTYAQYSGTSLATAYMTGVVALILEKHNYYQIDKYDKNLPKDIMTLLKNHSIELGNKEVYGYGFVRIS